MDNSQNSLPATTCQPSTVITASERQRYTKITVASLCCNADEAIPTTTATTEGHHSHRFRTFSASYAAETAICHQLGCSRSAVILPSPSSLNSEDRNSFIYATQTAFCCSSDAVKLPDNEHDEADSRNATVLLSSTPFVTTGRDTTLYLRPNALRMLSTPQTTYTESTQCVPRTARPSYTEEQKFSIMYYRLIRELSWPEIENEYASFFNLRTKDGLTSVYYRIREDWGMKKVLSTGTDFISAHDIVRIRASNFSKKFLTDLGYLG